METQIICATYDAKAKIYESYMLFANEQQAIRAFTLAVEKNEVLNKWPEDYSLHKICKIKTATGEIIENTIEKLTEAKFLIPQKNENQQKPKN